MTTRTRWRRPFAGLLLLAGVAGAAGVTLAGPANAAEPEDTFRAASLRLGHADVMRFDQTVGTVVVGDSGVIGATAIDDRTVVLTALEEGQTNVLVLGQDGQILSRLSVRVSRPRDPTATVYKGTSRTTLVCDPRCRPAPGGAGAPAGDPDAPQPSLREEEPPLREDEERSGAEE